MGYRDINKLFAESAGRCNYPDCREILFYEYKDQTFVALGELSHIIGESHKGPRGNPKTSVILKTDTNNLILLCRKHHKIIDGNTKEYPVEKLLNMKKEHLEWVSERLDISKETNWTLILHSGNIIGKGIVRIDEELIFKDFIGTHIIANVEKIEVPEFLPESKNWNKFKEIQEIWWKEYQNLNDKPIKFIICSINYIPLIIHLGYLIHDTSSSEIYQYNRKENTWKWQKFNKSKINSNFFKVEKEVKDDSLIQKIAISISISGEISDEDIFKAINKEIQLIKIRVNNPNRNWLEFYEQLVEFQRFFIELIDTLISKYNNLKEIHLFYAGPTPIAYILGCSINPNMHPKFILYNYHLKNEPKYSIAFDIN